MGIRIARGYTGLRSRYVRATAKVAIRLAEPIRATLSASVADSCGRSLRVFRELGERLGLAFTLHELARLAFERDEDEPATELVHEGLVLSRELGNRRGICFALAGLARGARRPGDYARAGALLGGGAGHLAR